MVYGNSFLSYLVIFSNDQSLYHYRGPQHGNLLEAIPRMVLIDFFNDVASTISQKLTRDHTRDERGLTDELIDNLVRWNQSSRENNVLLGSNWEFELRMTKVSQKLESTLGADIGFQATLDTRICHIEKGLLFQCKRLHPTEESEFTPKCHYGDLTEDHGLEQAKNMLNHTPASYFLLFNPSMDHLHTDSELVDGSILRSDHTPGIDGFQDILILPATTRLGLKKSGSIEDLFPHTTPFSQFMVQDVMQCNVGDTSSIALSIVRNENKEFTVRFSLKMELSQRS